MKQNAVPRCPICGSDRVVTWKVLVPWRLRKYNAVCGGCRSDSVYAHRRDQEVYKEESKVIISRKRLEEMIAGRMEQKERERMLFQRMEDLENNFNRRIREL
mgnify:CR=1 FL=1